MLLDLKQPDSRAQHRTHEDFLPQGVRSISTEGWPGLAGYQAAACTEVQGPTLAGHSQASPKRIKAAGKSTESRNLCHLPER